MTTGAEHMVVAARAAGIDTCFANPGTSEVRIVGALDEVGGVRSVLCLFEGVATGAADGYARVSGRPAMTLLHLGPGLSNGLANLHNARRARSPIVNVVGEHAAWHLAADSPITTDTEALARTVSSWVRTSATADALGSDMADAVHAARSVPGGIATLLAPMDCQWSGIEAKASFSVREPNLPAAVDEAHVADAASALAHGPRSILYIGGGALTSEALQVVSAIQKHTGCSVYVETFQARMDRGGGLPWFRTLPYFPERARRVFADITAVVTVGADAPVYMFGDPDGTSSPVPESTEVVVLAGADEDCLDALARLADRTVADWDGTETPTTTQQVTDLDDSAPLNARSIGLAVAAALPDGSVVVEEAGTSAFGYNLAAAGAARHTVLGLPGGSIGMGLPVSIGAAVAAQDRRVVALQADGSAMYTLQALWTLAREALDVTIVLFANQRYAVLGTELERAGFAELGATAAALIDLEKPSIDWVEVAQGLGVPARRPTSVGELRAVLAEALGTSGPLLIHACI